jgi:NitT/TauT family transport system ATP-binding protein
MSIPLFTLKNISKSFSTKEGKLGMHVLQDVNLTVHQGEFLLLLGPSGCGKSTLLRIIIGLETHTHGTIEFHNNSGLPLDINDVSFVFQNFGLLPWLSVEKNVELGLIGRRVLEVERKEKVKKILVQFGLSDFAQYRPRDLSGGMRQRVGLARAFVTEPKIIFLDEPFSELDFYTAEGLRQILLDMWGKNKTTIVMVSHYVEEAVLLADRIAVFSDRPGTILEIIKDGLARPRDHRSPEFFALEDEVLSKFKK